MDKDKALEFLNQTLFMGTDKAIEMQEQEGNESFVKSETLPTQMSSEDKEALESFGIRFLGVVEDDPLFQYVELPTGWTKRQDDSYWSYLIDSKCRERASIFYKAAFYDRDASIFVINRLVYKEDHHNVNDSSYDVLLDGEVIFSTDIKNHKVAKVEAINWLNSNYPSWESPSSYWD